VNETQQFLNITGNSCEDANRLINPILDLILKDSETQNRILDPRILESINYLKNVPDWKIQVSELASKAGLSESRYMHLFSLTMGVPLRRYLLWKKLIDGLLLIRAGESLTMAAMEAGFADYAHFSRTFKQNFGTSLKSIFRNSRFVHVSFCQL
jgi:AraC-like DNA-binding protein